MLMFDRKQENSVKQLSFNKNTNLKTRKKKRIGTEISIRHPVGLQKDVNYLRSMRFHVEHKIFKTSHPSDLLKLDVSFFW